VHNNYYFLRQLTAQLVTPLTGTVISECFSQSKDELILRFETHHKPFFIKAALESSFACLAFPDNFQRAKKNSIDLFPGLIGFRVQAIRQFSNERSFALMLDDQKALLFKMHGNRSNVILFENATAVELFKNNSTADQELTLTNMDRNIDWSYETFLQHQDKPESLYFTFGKIVWTYLYENGYNKLALPEKWDLIRKTVSIMEFPSYFLSRVKNAIHLTLLPFSESKLLPQNPIEATNEFYYVFTHDFALEKEKSVIINILKSKLSGAENYYEKNFEKLAEIERDTNFKIWADLIMANMHDIKQGMEKIKLKDFYQEDHYVEIKLKKELSPQSNAALFYKKSKNQHIEIDRIQQSLRTKETEIAKLKNEIEQLRLINDLKLFRQKVNALGIHKESEKQSVSLPYHEFIHNGFKILVGKNAQANDELTFRHGFKEDLWLHAKDVSGSHVLIKYQSGKNFPKDVIERAAALAAYNSKRKTETLCPVIVTPKKFVRKRKGDPAGAVVVEREEVIMVTPKLM
jgi:predicted ribosome quality control (RQC) complex YloA/Tae2 family protein